MTMNQTRRDSLRAATLCATRGPWGVSGSHGSFQVGPSQGDGWAMPCLEADARGNDNAQNDCDFAALAREAVPELLDALEASETRCVALAAEVADYRDALDRISRGHAGWDPQEIAHDALSRSGP